MDPELLADRYALLSTVGRGSTGHVWRATDTLLERPVAIKIVEIEGAKDPAMAERFRREGVAIAGLNHPAIVQVFDTGTDERRGWLVMELLTGPNFNALVKDKGPIGFEVGLPLLAEVASGLQAAHDHGITHRDVKPANIVLDAAPDADGTLPDLMDHPEMGRPVLVDFGIARLVDEAGTQLTRPATAIGTAAYMSPEQARGQEVDPPSDVYSLGCVTYHLLLGRPPFMADSSIAIAHAQAFDTPTPMSELDPSVPEALDALVARMLSKDPADRPTAAEVSGEMLAIAANPDMAPTVAAPGPAAVAAAQAGGVAERAEAANWTRNAGRWIVGLVFALMLAALAYTWFAPEPPPPPIPTVTITSTATHTQTATPAPQDTPEPGPTIFNPVTEPPLPTTTPPPTTTSAPPTSSAPPTTAPPTTAATTPAAPPTTAPPPTTPAPVNSAITPSTTQLVQTPSEAPPAP